MPEFRCVPELIRANGRWVFDEFTPTQPAFMFEDYVGKKGTVYVVQCAGNVKIGISRNFKSRLKQLNSASPLPMGVVATRSVPLAGLAYAEAWLHKRFAAYRLHGEWFSAEPGEVRAALALAVRRAAMYERYCLEWSRWTPSGKANQKSRTG